MNKLTRVVDDLVVAFGFSKGTAIKAAALFENGETLTLSEGEAIRYILEQDPFRMGQKEIPVFPGRHIKTLKHLNYRLNTNDK